MNQHVFYFQCPSADRELLLAFLTDLNFSAFVETDAGLEAYLPPGLEPAAVVDDVQGLQQRFDFSFETGEIPHRNWNAIWEAGFQPIRVHDFCGVRAPFHPPFTEVKYDLIIQPRMAFGTGHHATTWLMMEQMEGLLVTDARVLDYGCGTGILAILAAKMGAGTVHAVDIEEEAWRNTRDNAALNNVQLDLVVHGELIDIASGNYDLILANINRNVILNSLPALYLKLKPAGVLLVSGVLATDREKVIAAALETGFSAEKKELRGEWSCLQFRKI